MRLDFEHLRGKGPLIISVIAGLMLLSSIISLFFYPKENSIEEIVDVEVQKQVEEDIKEAEKEVFYYGISSYEVNAESDKVKSGESLTTILGKYGLSNAEIYNIANKSKKVFDVRKMRAGKIYTALLDKEDNRLNYFIYDIDTREYVKYSLRDTIVVERIKRKVETNRKTLHVNITSSLWESVINAGGNAALVATIEDIFQWTIDFYGIRPGDSFSFVYDENFIEGKSVGIGDIVAASYQQRGDSKYAFRYTSKGTTSYWDENGKSLKRAFLKAPLRFSRISSKFTYRRLHPVHKVYKAHTGVDYAAPSGTPVMTIADGVVTDKFYNRGGGNTLKIKHYVSNGRYMSGYLHLRSFAKGIKKGSKVKQGQIIGYVGSTGVSTGPHLDFRIWRDGKPIDPLKMDNLSGDPLSSTEIPRYKESISNDFSTLKSLEGRSMDNISDGDKRSMERERNRLDNEERITVEEYHEI